MDNQYLWKKYCSFFDQSFPEQLKYNRAKLSEHFSLWSQTKTAEKLCPHVNNFEEVPFTTYEDYPILDKFGNKVQEISANHSRKDGELSWEYYQRISKKAAPILKGWLPEKFLFCGTTTGTTGDSKWIPYGKTFKKNLTIDSIALPIIGCSRKPGQTDLKAGDNILNILAPAPHAAGTVLKAWQKEFELVPSIEVMESTNNMIKKLGLIIDLIKDGKKIDVFGGVASPLKILCDYLKDPRELFQEYYKSVDFGVAKIYLFIKYLKEKYFGKKYEKLSEALPLKGIGTVGMDSKLYASYLKDEFELEPLNVFGCSEFGNIMYGRPECKQYLVPSLRSCYFEFIDPNNRVKQVDELEKNKLYELAATGFGSMLIRYKTGDLFRVIDFREDRMPILDCEGRKDTWLDFYGYFRISERVITDAIIKAGLDGFEKWCVYKKVDHGSEKLIVLMEKIWGYSELKSSEKIFEALQKISPNFNDYVNDFQIEQAEQIIKVKYLSRGSFIRFTMKMKNKGVPLGQIKVPKIITNNEKQYIKMLEGI